MNKKRWWILLSLIAVVLFVGAWFVFSTGSKLQYKMEKIDKGDIQVMITATGKINPVTKVQVGTQVTGTLSKIYVDFNQKVKKGQVIAQIDPTFLKAQLLEAEANLEKAKAQVDQSQKTSERASELFDRKLISQSEKEEAATNYNLALAQHKQAQAAYHRAEVSLQYTTIISPIDGVVISRNVDVGQTVAASLQAPILFVIANDLSQIQVEATIDEVDIGKVKVGQDVSFYVDAYSDEKFSGTVAQIRLQPIISQSVVSYEVIIDVANKENKLLPGMTANLSIIVETKKNVNKAPNMALRYQPSLTQEQFKSFSERLGGQFDMKNNTILWSLSEQGQLEPIIIKPGITDGNYTEIKEGFVSEGVKVIVGVSSGPGTTGSTKGFVPPKK
jgi:HlyD family secretion protein